jgi:antirestriction protein ArdC
MPTIPENALTENTYNGVNILLLMIRQMDGMFAQNKWLTFKQAKEMGGSVSKGEKGCKIVKVGKFVPKDQKQLPEDEQRQATFLKGYTVFNIEQIDGLPGELFDTPEAVSEPDQVKAAEAIARNCKADIRFQHPQAFYMPSEDYVNMPRHETFYVAINYYRTLFHELGHWTGHSSRLDRKLADQVRTTQDRAKEELVAEMCAAFCCAKLGIQPTVRHADYIGSWLEALRNDSKMIIQAASLASKAADYLLAYAEDELRTKPLPLTAVPAPKGEPLQKIAA